MEFSLLTTLRRSVRKYVSLASREDIVAAVIKMLHKEGYTIKGVQKLLKLRTLDKEAPSTEEVADSQKVREFLDQMRDVREMLKPFLD